MIGCITRILARCSTRSDRICRLHAVCAAMHPEVVPLLDQGAAQDVAAKMQTADQPQRLLGYFAAAVPVPDTESDGSLPPLPSPSSDLLVLLATQAIAPPLPSAEPSCEGDQALASAVHVCLTQRLQLLWEQHARLANACKVTMTKKKASAAAGGGKAATRRRGVEGDAAAAPEADDNADADEGSSASGTEEEEDDEAALAESAAASTAAAAASAAADAEIAAAAAVAAEARAAALSAKEQEARLLTGLLLAPLLAPSQLLPSSLSPPPLAEDSSSSWCSCLRLLPFWAPWAEQRALGEVLSHMLQLAASAAAAGETSPPADVAEARHTERGFDNTSPAVGGSRALLGLQELLRLAPVQQALPEAIVGLAGKLIEQVTMPG